MNLSEEQIERLLDYIGEDLFGIDTAVFNEGEFAGYIHETREYIKKLEEENDQA